MLIATAPGDSQAAQVTLQWDAVPGQNVARYCLFARQSGNNYDYTTPIWDEEAAAHTEGNTVTCILTELTDGAQYYFVVRAVDSQGNQSGDSNEVSFQTAALTGGTQQNPSEPDANDNQNSGVDTYQPTPEVDISPPEDPATDSNPPDTPELEGPANNSTNVNPETELATGSYSDPDNDDPHTYTRWLVYRDSDDLCIFDQTSDIQLTSIKIPPLVLDGDTAYYWTAIHYNRSGAASQPAENGYFTTGEWVADSGNPNGIPDSYEILEYTNLDNNDFADDTQNDMKCFMSIYNNQMIGVKATTGGQEQLIAAQPIDPSTISTPVGFQPTTPFGLVNFKINLAADTESAYVTIYFSEPIVGSYSWIIYDPVWGYAEFGEDCSISSNRKVVTLFLEDGAPGDMDGTKNGIIVAITGYAGNSNEGSTTSSSLADDDSFVSDWEWEPEYSCFIKDLF